MKKHTKSEVPSMPPTLRRLYRRAGEILERIDLEQETIEHWNRINPKAAPIDWDPNGELRKKRAEILAKFPDLSAWLTNRGRGIPAFNASSVLQVPTEGQAPSPWKSPRTPPPFLAPLLVAGVLDGEDLEGVHEGFWNGGRFLPVRCPDGFTRRFTSVRAWRLMPEPPAAEEVEP